MEKIEFEIDSSTSYIELQNFLKLIDQIATGGEAKMYLVDNDVYVNGQLESRRGKKLYPGDTIKIGQQVYIITKS